MKLKYVVFDDVFPVVFGEYAQHREVKIGLACKPTSAGFFTMAEVETPRESRFVGTRMIEVNPYGESISLNLKSKPTDKFLLEKLFND